MNIYLKSKLKTNEIMSECETVAAVKISPFQPKITETVSHQLLLEVINMSTYSKKNAHCPLV